MADLERLQASRAKQEARGFSEPTAPVRDTARETAKINELGLDTSQITPDIEKDLFEATYSPEELSGLTDYKTLVKGQSRLASQAKTALGEAQGAFTGFKPGQMMGVLEEALRTKTDVGAQPLGTSELFEKAGIPQTGVAGFKTLTQSLNENSRAMEDRYGSFVNVLDKAGRFVGEEYKALADNYKFAIDQYNDERARLDGMIDNIVKQEQAMAMVEKEVELFKEKQEFISGLEPTAQEKLAAKEKGYTYVQGEYVPTGSFEAIFADVGDPNNDLYGECAYMSNRITSGEPGDKQWLGNMYEEKIGKVTHYDNPTIGDKLVTKTRMPYGHVGTVIDWNPETRNVQVVEWNKGGDHQMEVNEYNIDELSNAYSDTATGTANWGFVEATLKPEIAQKLSGIAEGGGDIGTLTPAQRSAGAVLAKQLYGTIKTEEQIKNFLNPILERMAAGESIDTIADDLRFKGQSPEFTGMVRDAAQQITSKLSDKKTQTVFDKLDDVIGKGDGGQLRDFLKKMAIEHSAGGTEQAKMIMGQERTVEFLDEIADDLKTLEDNGISTNIFTGNLEAMAKKVGAVANADMRAVATKIMKARQQYRRSMTGVAFSPGENLEYDAIFPSIDKTANFNTATITALKEAFRGDVDFFYSFAMGEDAYNEIFKNASQGGGTSQVAEPTQADIDYLTSLNLGI